MLATVVLDSYREEEKGVIAEAIDHLTGFNNGNWSSSGVYSFWNYYTKEILYVGLAVDLTKRFQQHNGLLPADAANTKSGELKEYFKLNQRIGFSVVMQSALSQPMTSTYLKKYDRLTKSNPTGFLEIGDDGRESIKRLEGIFLESFKQMNGVFPSWNKMGGSRIGQLATKPQNYHFLKLLTELGPSRYISRATIRELAAIPLFNQHESYLHALRISPFGKEVLEEILGEKRFDKIKSTGYFGKRLEL